MEEFTEDRVTREYAAPEPASGTISESETLDSVDDGDLPFRHTRPYFEWERNRGNRLDDAAIQVRQPTYPAHEVDLRPKRLDPGLIAFNDFDPHAIAPYNRLVISLISAAASRKLKRVLIASAQKGDGRTTVTLNLAAALARARQRVLVVESDFLRPSASRLLGIDSTMGLAEAVAKGLAPGNAMVWLQPIGFNLMPTCAQVENSAELLASPYFEVMMRTLSPEFDFILFDSAPLLAAADARLLEHHTDATLIVIREGGASTSQMAKAVALLNEQRLLGAVLNRVVT
jgi:Mrp family chromosome partitioning ATPase